MKIGIVYIRFGKVRQGWIRFNDSFCCFTILLPPRVLIIKLIVTKTKLEIAQSEQDVSPFCKESDMTYS